jgi:Flp pilus assembly protein TadG
MIDIREIFRSVGDVWLLWLGSTAGLAALTAGAVKGFRRLSLARLLRGEGGAAYSLVYVMVFPIFMLLVCLVVETTLVLMVKAGTVYAAYAAVRSDAVWSSARPDRSSERRRLAAVQAMTPFAASGKMYAQGAGVDPPSAEARRFYQAYREVAQGSTSEGYLLAKYQFAERATQVEDAEAGPGEVAVRVTYEMPLHVPGAGRVIGGRASWPGARFYTRRIRSTATLPDERPVGPSGTLGIDYVSE